MSNLTRRIFLVFAFLAISTSGFTIPIYQAPGGIRPEDRLVISLQGSDATLNRFTIGLVHLDRISAGLSDPDFQVQALQADRVTILHEYGRTLNRDFSFNYDPASFGIFILREASLRDFSLGRNLYRPVFSLPGSPGSHLSDSTLTKDGSLQVIEFALGGSGQVRGTGTGAPLDNTLGVSILDRSINADESPVVPEPATLGLVGIGLAGLATRFRNRNQRK